MLETCLELISESNRSCRSGVPKSGSNLPLPRAPMARMTGVLTNSTNQNNCSRSVCIRFPKHIRVEKYVSLLDGSRIMKNGVAFRTHHNMKAPLGHTLRLKMYLRQPPQPIHTIADNMWPLFTVVSLEVGCVCILFFEGGGGGGGGSIRWRLRRCGSIPTYY